VAKFPLRNCSQARLNLGQLDEAPENNTITRDIDNLKQELGSLCKVVQNSMNPEKPKDHTALFLNPQLSYLMSANQNASSSNNGKFFSPFAI